MEFRNGKVVHETQYFRGSLRGAGLAEPMGPADRVTPHFWGGLEGPRQLISHQPVESGGHYQSTVLCLAPPFQTPDSGLDRARAKLGLHL
jgi:hypothetical protein